MGQIRMDFKDGHSEWWDIGDEQIDRDGYLQIFTVRVPQTHRHAGIHHVHLIRPDYPFRKTAEDIWNAQKKIRSAKNLCEKFERLAAEMAWYDAEQFPSVRQHVGKFGALIASGPLLYKFVNEHHSFTQPGYYDAQGTRIMTGAAHINDDYRK